jgi:hypothetical protein
MSEISTELLMSELKKHTAEYKNNSSMSSFGEMMNSKYHFQNQELSDEKDQLLAFLMILAKHVKL